MKAHELYEIFKFLEVNGRKAQNCQIFPNSRHFEINAIHDFGVKNMEIQYCI